LAVREILSALARRWYVVVIGVLLTVGAGWYVYTESSPEYTARGLVLLLPAEGEAELAGSNPFLGLGGLELPARVLVATYSNSSFQEEVAEVSPTAEVEVSIDESTRGPVIVVEARDVGIDRTLSTLDYVIGTVGDRLDELQSEVGVDETAVVRSMVLTVDTAAEPDFQSLIRLLVIVGGGGIAVTLIAALVIDVLVERRTRRHSGLASGGRRRPRRKGTASSETPVEEPSGDENAYVPDPNPTVVIGRKVPGPRAATRTERH